MGNSIGAISMAAMFAEANRYFGKDLVWQTRGESQRKWFEDLLPFYLKMLPQLSESLDSTASTDCDAVNRFIRSKGMDVQLQNQGSNNVYIAAFFEWMFKWARQGEDITQYWGKGFEAYKLSRGEGQEMRFFKTDLSSTPAVLLNTKSDHMVTIVRHDRSIAMLDILVAALTASRQMVSKNQIDEGYEGMRIHSVDVNATPDISFLINACPVDPAYPIGQAISQVKWGVNRFGGSGKEIAAMMMRKGMSEYYDVDWPYVFAVWKKGLTYPIFASWVDANDRVRVGNQPETMRRRSVTRSPEYGE